MVREDAVEERPEWVQAVVNAVARAQVFARENREETSRMLSDESSGYLPQPLPAVRRSLAVYDTESYTQSGAIQHPGWENNRIDFQPFPFPSYTEELVRLLRDMEVEGDGEFLKSLDPARAHEELVDDRFAREAIEKAGGATRFGLPESLSRRERLAL